ncbi:protein ALP1-like [Camellia sinensis]|uniref:protein ALP1-like n=1 Tax=Camellia sinensis TaxID=4442 RepID=UPI0010368B97|nr:protein ALP1-like [Camellia sinensis]
MNPWDGSNNDGIREMLNQMAVQVQQEHNCTFLQACQYAIEWYEKHMAKTPCRTSILTGVHGYPNYMRAIWADLRKMFACRRKFFVALCETLVNNFWLQVPQRPHGLAIEESVAMFIHVLKWKQNREIQERFQHSGETVSRHVHNVLTSMKEFTVVHCRPTYSHHRIHPYVRSRRKCLPFKDYIGAIDGTHVSTWVTGPDAATYFGRKYCHTQNIMAAVDFDMCFIFISCGWEGSMHDSRIFNKILTNDNVPFPHPDEDKYYLVDSGYPNRIGYLAPFKGNRYHQQEFQRIPRNMTANTPRELFNKVHSSLRSVVERTFGAWKN